jgi:regulator of RNase E activity RraA
VREGRGDVAVTYGGVMFVPGACVAADRDGIVVASAPLA